MRIVLLGLAGAGKGTQGQALAQRLGVPFVASGDLFRSHQAQGTELGLLAKGHMERGELVPDEVTIRMILERIGEADCAGGFILDGFPRTLAQAEALDRALRNKRIDRAVYIRVGEEELVRRLSGRINCRRCGTPYQRDSLPRGAVMCPNCGGELYQRPDDQPEVVRRRIRVQWPELSRLVEYYSNRSKLQEVNGEQSVELVRAAILKAIAQPAPAL
ncbi:MAG: adenylate kinase [Chloroflexi bacterium]|nr:adenylate kinase [Chloroflexota bacterium]